MTRARKKRDNGDNVQVNFWLSRDMRNELQVDADEQDRSMAWVLRSIVADYLLKKKLGKEGS